MTILKHIMDEIDVIWCIFRGWNADHEKKLIEDLASNLGQQEVWRPITNNEM